MCFAGVDEQAGDVDAVDVGGGDGGGAVGGRSVAKPRPRTTVSGRVTRMGSASS